MSGRKHPRDKRIANRAVQALIVKAQILALANKENEQAIEERLLNERRKKYSGDRHLHGLLDALAGGWFA